MKQLILSHNAEQSQTMNVNRAILGTFASTIVGGVVWTFNVNMRQEKAATLAAKKISVGSVDDLMADKLNPGDIICKSLLFINYLTLTLPLSSI